MSGTLVLILSTVRSIFWENAKLIKFPYADGFTQGGSENAKGGCRVILSEYPPVFVRRDIAISDFHLIISRNLPDCAHRTRAVGRFT